MGNHFYFVKKVNFLSYTPVASPAPDPVYDATNLYNYGSITRCFKSTSTSAQSIVLDTGGTNTIIGVMLDYVNFTSGVLIQGNASDSWGTPTYDSTNTVSLDYRVNRYKIYKDSTNWSCRFIRVYIPSQTVTDGTNFRIGRITILGAKTEPSQNPFYPYSYEAAKRYIVNEFESGSEEVIKIGSHKIWKCEFGIDYLKDANEQEWWDLDNNDEDQLMVVYENCTDTSKCYICQKSGTFSIEEIGYGVKKFSNFILKEKV
jgi:hypothetical protein